MVLNGYLNSTWSAFKSWLFYWGTWMKRTCQVCIAVFCLYHLCFIFLNSWNLKKEKPLKHASSLFQVEYWLCPQWLHAWVNLLWMFYIKQILIENIVCALFSIHSIHFSASKRLFTDRKVKNKHYEKTYGWYFFSVCIRRRLIYVISLVL